MANICYELSSEDLFAVFQTDRKTDPDGRSHTEQIKAVTTWLPFVAKEVFYRCK